MDRSKNPESHHGGATYQAGLVIHLTPTREHVVLLTATCQCAWHWAETLAEVISKSGKDCTIQTWRGDATDSPKTRRFYAADTDELPF